MKLHPCKILFLYTFAFAFVEGCDFGGPRMYDVSGEVRFDGQLVPRGNITFIPNDPSQRTAATSFVDGRYNLEMEAGARKVQITASEDSGPYNPEMGQAPKAQYIPGKYNIETELKAEIVPDGENRFDFDLHSNGKSR